MKKILLFLYCFILLNHVLSGQKLQLEVADGWSFSNIEKASPYSSEARSNERFLRLSYSHIVNRNWSIDAAFFMNTPFVAFNIKEYPHSIINQLGLSYGDFFNLRGSATYRLFIKRRLILNSCLGINMSYYRRYSKRDLWAFDGTFVSQEITLRGEMETLMHEGFQFRPEFSLGIEWLFLKYFSLEFKAGYIQGTRRIMDATITYTLMESEEYIGKTYTYGSLWYPSIGLSFYFGGYSNKFNKNIKEKEDK